jgi:hypothetical protein
VIYYGKIQNSNLTTNDVSTLIKLDITTSIDLNLTVSNGIGYIYILIPKSMPQPSIFRNSNSGCNGFVIPIISKPDVSLIDNFGYLTIYSVYRTYVSTNAEVDIWLCE